MNARAVLDIYDAGAAVPCTAGNLRQAERVARQLHPSWREVGARWESLSAFGGGEGCWRITGRP